MVDLGSALSLLGMKRHENSSRLRLLHGVGSRKEKQKDREMRQKGEREEGLTGTKFVSTGPATKASCPATAFKNSILVLGPIT